MMNNVSLSVGYEDNSLIAQAKALASELHLPLDNQSFPRLSVTSDKLVLLIEGCSPLYADFHSQALSRRREAGKAQGLIRACKPKPGLKILDATAGWGRDAALLASFGAEVLMVERHPVMHALLADALSCLNAEISVDDIQKKSTHLKLSLIASDAKSYLQQLSPDDYPDVIYIDPMHPTRQKSALVKKDMQIMQQLIGADEDAEALLQVAIHCARQRVVVKWPQRLPPIIPPNHSVQGKTVRFDVFL